MELDPKRDPRSRSLELLQAELAAAAERAGIAVRVEPLARARGGLCTLRGRRVILIDARAPVTDRVATLASALARVDLDGVELLPIVRATIGAYQRGPTVAPAGREPRPLARARKRG